jgi:probable F420-dependent oxidoreductase
MLEGAQWAESMGYDDVWLADAGQVDALTMVPTILDRTERIRVGIAVVPAYTRTPAVFAATLAAIDAIAPGRFVLGLGSSSHAMIEGWHGLPFERPLTTVRETAELIRSMSSGKRSDYDGIVRRSHGYQQPALTAPVPIHLAALRPKMIDTAVELAEGLILNLFPIDAMPTINRVIEESLDRHLRPRASIEVGSRIQIAVTSEPERARDTFRQVFIPYYANPSYNLFLEWAGRPDAAAAVRKGWAENDRAACYAALDDDLVDQIAVIGSRAHCQDRIRELYRQGISTPMLFCLSSDPQVHRDTFEAFSPEQFSI